MAKVARAVWPNAGVAAWYRTQLNRIIDQMSADMLLRITEAWEENPPDIGILATDAATASPTLLQRTMTRWANVWTGKLETLSVTLATRFAGLNFAATQAAMLAAFKDAGFTVKFRPTRKSMNAYKAVIAENIGLIKSIPEQYLAGVQNVVWAAVRKGGDLHTASVAIRKRYGVTINRAALIARDQNNKAKAVIENVRRQEAGFTHGIWMHSSAGKEPRPTHVAMNGKRFKLNEGMYDSDEKKNVYPGELINCRCASRVVLEGYE